MSDCTTYWLHALTPVHVGVGFGSGFIDLPIMREKTTGWPVIPGSSVKGVTADAFDSIRERETDPAKARHLDAVRQIAFGQGGDDNASSGSVVFTDARIICLAVRSYYGTFAYATAPLVLARLVRDAEGTQSSFSGLDVPAINAETAELPAIAMSIIPFEADKEKQNKEKYICLSELKLKAVETKIADKWAEAISSVLFKDEKWAHVFRARFAIIPDETFDFLCETACEVNARIKLNRTRKIVERGHFWYEESLPAESILSGLVWCDRVYGGGERQIASEDVISQVCGDERILQVGGKATIGKGRMRFCLESRKNAKGAADA